MKRGIKSLFNKEKTLFLAYDQGLEHGPSDFNDENINPSKIIGIAGKGKYNAFICQKGIAEKYSREIANNKVKLIVKLNGKTNLANDEPFSRQICSVKEAIKLGAIAVGYTIYIGSEHEEEMMREFALIEEEAHASGLIVIAWIYPAGKAVVGKNQDGLMEYAARVGLEIGADIAKIKYSGNKAALKKAVVAAGKCKIVIAGGIKAEEDKFLQQVKDIMDAGAVGLAVGRNVWQNSNPGDITRKIKKIVFGK